MEWNRIGRLERGKDSLIITGEFGGREIHGTVSLEAADDLLIFGQEAPITFEGREVGHLRQSETGKAVVAVCCGFPNCSGSWAGYERLINHDHGPAVLLAAKPG